jgi:urocanate hydratase
VINGGFGLVLDGSQDSQRRIDSMISWDVNNGLARRSWARNERAEFAISRAMDANDKLSVTMPNRVEEKLLEDVFKHSR